MARLAVATIAAVTLGAAVAVLAIPSERTYEVAAGPPPPDGHWIPVELRAPATTTTVPPSPRVLPGAAPSSFVPRRPAATVPAKREMPLTPRPATVAAPKPSGGWSGPWACIAEHESGGNPATNTGNGYYGGLQFSLSTWRAYGGIGLPSQAPIVTQEAIAERVLAGQGWRAWPNTSRMCGL